MPRIAVNGIRLHYEEAGQGVPLVFVHEFAGEAQSWQLQVRFFARRYRTIVFNARGYPPSDVPTDGSRLLPGSRRGGHPGPARRPRDRPGARLRAVHGRLRDAPLRPPPPGAGAVAGRGGLRVREPGRRPGPVQARRRGHGRALPDRAHGDARRRLLPGAHAGAVPGQGPEGLAGVPRPVRGPVGPRPRPHDAGGPAHPAVASTSSRPSSSGSPCRRSSSPGTRTSRASSQGSSSSGRSAPRGWSCIPKAGHTINLEEPEAFNRAVLDFLTAVESGRWGLRNPASQTGSAILPSATGGSEE